MLNNLFSQKQLLKEACNRLDDCDELLLMRALKTLTNTEISALISALPVHHTNQILIILPKDVTKRVVSLGFNGELKLDTIRKFIGMIDREVETARLINSANKPAQMQNTINVDTCEKGRDETSIDITLPPSIRVLDALGRFVSNTFRKT